MGTVKDGNQKQLNPPDERKDTRGDLLKEIGGRLEREYGRPELAVRPEQAMDILILTILSQATNDRNRDRAFHRLKQRYSSWDQVLQASDSDIAETIQEAGLHHQKAWRIREVLRTIREREGSLRLEGLRRMPVTEGIRYLQSLPGVGPKTAACVLLFGFGLPVFPVDTHIHRIARRLGLVEGRLSAEKTQQLLNEAVSPKDMYPLHLNLINHGRQVCRARKPACTDCVLRDLCPGVK